MVDHGKDNDAWTDNIRRQLETSARDLDGASLSRLNQARQAALKLAKQPKPLRWLWPALTATAFSLALAVALWPRLQLQSITGDDRYRPSQWLRRRAQLGLSATTLE